MIILFSCLIWQNQFAAKKCFCKTSFSAHALEDVQCTIYAPVFFCLNWRNIQHFMCNRACKNYNDIGTAYFILKICGTLCKHLALTAVIFTYFLVTAVHSVVSSNNCDTHFITSISSFYAVQNNSSSVLPSFKRFTTALRQAVYLQNIFCIIRVSIYFPFSR